MRLGNRNVAILSQVDNSKWTLVVWGGEFGRTPTVELTGADAS
ncbi:DUF1501 domain-containing protein [Rubripirellula reticaptiva]|nr:DUF1501 domain-containing protein [Rubripirellula reticaptiva]